VTCCDTFNLLPILHVYSSNNITFIERREVVTSQAVAEVGWDKTCTIQSNAKWKSRPNLTAEIWRSSESHCWWRMKVVSSRQMKLSIGRHASRIQSCWKVWRAAECSNKLIMSRCYCLIFVQLFVTIGKCCAYCWF